MLGMRSLKLSKRHHNKRERSGRKPHCRRLREGVLDGGRNHQLLQRVILALGGVTP